jgi:hypothetical protein
MTDPTPTTTTEDDGIEAAVEAAQIRAAANQYRLKLRQHQQLLKDIRTGDRR